MRRKNLMMALMCTFCLAVSCVAPAAVMAEETETVETEAAEEESAAGEENAAEEESAAGEDVEEESTEAETTAEELIELPERPDYEASGYVTLGNYTGLTVILDSTEVTDEEVEAEIQYELQYLATPETLTEGTVRNGDTANIDYEGKKDGVAFDGGTAQGFDLEIGSHSFIDGFEDGLIGVSVGETVDLNLTFPENYGNTELAGQDVVFTVTVNEIKRAPELTDEVAESVSGGQYTDVESYRQGIRDMLELNKEQQQEYNIRADLLTQVANISEITGYPQEMVDYNVASMELYYRQMAEQFGMEFEDFLSAYLGMTLDDFNEQAVLACQEILQQELYLKAIAEAEGIEITDEEYEAGVERYVQQYGYESAEQLIAETGKGEIIISLLQEKVFDFLKENAIITQPEPETETENMTELTPAELVEADAEGETEETPAETGAEEITEAAAEETEADTEE